MDYTDSDAQADLVDAILTAWENSPYSHVVAYGENLTRPNMDNLQSVMEYSIDFTNRKQVTLADNPIVRTTGKVVLTFGVRQGQGKKLLTAMREHMDRALRARWIGKVFISIPYPSGETTVNGWTFINLTAPLRFDARSVYNP